MERLTREFEQTLPSFSSHAEARAYFKEQFGDRFMIASSKEIEGEKIYFYNLLLDADTYWKHQEGMKAEGQLHGEADDKRFCINHVEQYLNSYQRMEIGEDGRIHILY